MKYDLVFINLTWLLGGQMANIILKGSHSLKIMNIVLKLVFLEVLDLFMVRFRLYQNAMSVIVLVEKRYVPKHATRFVKM